MRQNKPVHCCFDAFVFSGGASFLETSIFKTSNDVPPFHQSLYWFVSVSFSFAALYIGGIGFLAGTVIIALDRSVVGLRKRPGAYTVLQTRPKGISRWSWRLITTFFVHRKDCKTSSSTCLFALKCRFATTETTAPNSWSPTTY